MKKRKQPIKKIEERQPTLKDSLNSDLLKKLQDTKKSLVDQENMRQEEQKKEKEAARVLREKNKSFEELFEESNMKWQDFKR